MALETMKGVEQINGVKILLDRPRTECGSIDWQKTNEMRKEYPIYVDHDANMISFRIQNGPIKDVGKNGCQVGDIIAVARHIIEKLNEKFPCEENTKTIENLAKAMAWQTLRTSKREARGVEGTSEL